MASAHDDTAPDPAWEGSGQTPDGARSREDNDGGAGEQSRKIIALRPLADDALDRACARFPMTDLGNAERFVHRHGCDFRFCAELGCYPPPDWLNRSAQGPARTRGGVIPTHPG